MQNRRINKRAPPSQGGWHSFQVSHAGTDRINPAACLGLRANGERAWFGWPDTSGACDGFNLLPPNLPGDFTAFVDHVLPELRRRGLFREEYSGFTLRDHFGLKRPANRYARSNTMV